MQIPSTEIEEVISAYAIGKIVAVEKLSSGFANINYKLTTDSGRFLYRICKQHHRGNIEYELRLMEMLKYMDFPTAYPVKGKNGEYISETPEGQVLLFEFVEGEVPEVNSKTVEEIAGAVGKLNACGNLKDLQKDNEISISSCRKLMAGFDAAKQYYPDIFEYFEEQTEYLAAPIEEMVPTGLVHADVFPDNTIFKDDKLQAIVDFEEACIDHLLFDVGMTINGFCFTQNQLNNNYLNIFIRAYNKVRPITKKEYDLLPYYIQWGAHGMLSWHLKYDLLNTEHPVQLKRARELMNRVKNLRKREMELFRIIKNGF